MLLRIMPAGMPPFQFHIAFWRELLCHNQHSPQPGKESRPTKGEVHTAVDVKKGNFNMRGFVSEDNKKSGFLSHVKFI